MTFFEASWHAHKVQCFECLKNGWLNRQYEESEQFRRDMFLTHRNKTPMRGGTDDLRYITEG